MTNYYFHKKRRKLSKSILNEEQNCALKSLRKDRNIAITKPDKGNGVVILNRNDYVDKMHEILMIVLNLCFAIKTQAYLISLNFNDLFTISIPKKHCAVKSTLEYIVLLQPLLLYTDYQNYTNLEFP